MPRSAHPPPLSIAGQLSEIGAYLTVGNGTLRATRGHCFVERTPEGWLLSRSAQHPKGRFFAERCTEAEAVGLIRDGDIERETQTLSQREQARRLLSDAIRHAFDADSPQAELLLEAVDLLCGVTPDAK